MVVGAFLAVLLLGVPTLTIPFYTDAADFALGARTILSGGVLYRDFWEVKTPAIYFIYAFAFVPFGQHMVSIRVLDVVNTALAMGAIYLLGRRFFGERAGVVAGCLYGLTYLTRAGYEGLGEVESFLALPVVAAVLLYRPNSQNRAYSRAFLSGVLLGLVFSLKLSAAFYVVALPAMEVMFAERPLRIAPPLRRLSIAAAGFLVIPAVFAVYLVAGGALRDFIDVQRLHVWPYTSLRWSPPGESFLHFGLRVTHDYFRSSLFLVVPAAGALFVALAGSRRKETALVALLAIASLAGVWSQGKFFYYHYLAMIFPLALLAGFAIDRVFGYASGPGARRWAAYGLAGAFLVLLTPSLLSNPYEQYRQFLGVATGTVSRADNEAHWNSLLHYNREVVDYVNTNGGGDKSLFVWGNWPIVYWWADQPLVSRFIFDTPLSATWAPDIWRSELIDDLQTREPHFIAIAHEGAQPWMTGTSKTSDERLQDYPALTQMLAQNYTPVFDNPLFGVFERRGS
ncbi:MAG: glycosyltransferase family 39 protein [Dehalococcoidia bacterium]